MGGAPLGSARHRGGEGLSWDPLGIMGITRVAGMKSAGCRVGGDEGYAMGEGSLQCSMAAALGI